MLKFIGKIKEFWKREQLLIKKSYSILVTLCTVVTALASVIIAKQALEVSEIALKSTSSTTEPIINIDVDWHNDKITVAHETSSVFQLKYITFGSVRTIAIMKNDTSMISSIEIQEGCTGMNLESGHTVGTDCSEEDAQKYNKSFELQLEYGDVRKEIDALQDNVYKKCEELGCSYWGVSPHYDYRYIVIEYVDVYGNRRNQYYIYKDEYATSWRLYKLSEEEFERYTESIVRSIDEQELLGQIFTQSNFKNFEETKYRGFSDWYNSEQFK